MQEAFKKHIEHMQRRSRKTKIHVDSGFYTKENMKKKLGWSASEPQCNPFTYIYIYMHGHAWSLMRILFGEAHGF